MITDFAWAWLTTVAIETIVLVTLMRHPLRDKLEAGLWLSSVTLPLVWFVIPSVLVAEVFAAAAECALFALCRRAGPRDLAVIVIANLASFSAGRFL